jgi:hypothetical protein
VGSKNQTPLTKKAPDSIRGFFIALKKKTLASGKQGPLTQTNKHKNYFLSKAKLNEFFQKGKTFPKKDWEMSESLKIRRMALLSEASLQGDPSNALTFKIILFLIKKIPFSISCVQKMR